MIWSIFFIIIWFLLSLSLLSFISFLLLRVIILLLYFFLLFRFFLFFKSLSVITIFKSFLIVWNFLASILIFRLLLLFFSYGFNLLLNCLRVENLTSCNILFFFFIVIFLRYLKLFAADCLQSRWCCKVFQRPYKLLIHKLLRVVAINAQKFAQIRFYKRRLSHTYLIQKWKELFSMQKFYLFFLFSYYHLLKYY